MSLSSFLSRWFSLLESDRCLSCGSINKRKRISILSLSLSLSLSASQRNEPTQIDASEVLRATSLLILFRKVHLKIRKSVRIPTDDSLATAIDQALNLNSSLDWDHFFLFRNTCARHFFHHPSMLNVSNNIISSATGIQQDDPLGPLLFAMSSTRYLVTSPLLSTYGNLTSQGTVEP
ncbi:unnamed protein product [Acanthosepion pharaonis]|uniref:Uncharacterized protein n=1 Tax=Acanthosepion pharaonis TaxID=158019 RepID=A0A812BWS3_ACAPH|nr:unnamed protein product [Sepia pharaonis]